MAVKDKVVIITGGAMGIGRYNARAFAAAGAKLAIADVASMETVASEVAALGAEVLPVQTDIRDEEQARMLMARVHEHYGRIDVLINGAGIVTHFQSGAPRWPRISDMESSFFDNQDLFPAGSASFDCALLMRQIDHEWHERPTLCCQETAG